MMKLFLSTIAFALVIDANRLLQQIPVDGGCANPPAGFSCLDNQECCDIGNGASCCNVTTPITTSTPTCGGIENCAAYTPDGCNTCRCGSNGLAACTKIGCQDTVDPNECTLCNDGYIPNDSGECETCFFTQNVDPVCCNDITFSNSGEAYCNQVSCPPGSEITKGICTTPTTTAEPLSACATVRCGVDGKTECYENPVNGEATCCAPDDSCDEEGYASTEVAVCMDDGGKQKYDNKCFGRCDGNANCGSLCRCDDSSQCIDGYECLETPFGFSGCDANVTDSCFGFCTKKGASCGGFVGNALCEDDETCFATPIAPGQQPVGSCYSLPDQCLETTTTETPAPSCGGIDYCRGYKPDPCNTCGCGDNGFEFCTQAFCGDSSLFENECTLCEDGRRPINNGTECDTCFCPFIYKPVCCNGETYSNACIAGCNQVSCTGEITEGECTTTTTTTTTTTESPSVITCTKQRDCDFPDYKCRKDPICRVFSSIRCSETDKVCIDYNPSDRCDEDGDCDKDNGYWCLSGYGGNGYCVKYEQP